MKILGVATLSSNLNRFFVCSLEFSLCPLGFSMCPLLFSWASKPLRLLGSLLSVFAYHFLVPTTLYLSPRGRLTSKVKGSGSLHSQSTHLGRSRKLNNRLEIPVDFRVNIITFKFVNVSPPACAFNQSLDLSVFSADAPPFVE